MINDNRLRSEFLNTQVITRNTGRRLGVIKEVLVDIDRREVVTLGLRDNRLSLSGLLNYMYLNSISQSGDVILVENEDVIDDINTDNYSGLINSEVITETGEPIGRVRDFCFSPVDGRVSTLIVASLGLPLIPEQLISTYELSMEEVISSGPNRLVVFEGAEERLTQLSVGILEKIGIGRPPWEKEEEESYYPAPAKPENQLPTGIPISAPPRPVELKAPPILEKNWDEDDWEEAPVVTPPQKKKAEMMRYQDEDEEDNWGGQNERTSRQKKYDYDVDQDVWDDDVEPDSYNPPRVNIPQKQKAPEYEEDF